MSGPSGLDKTSNKYPGVGVIRAHTGNCTRVLTRVSKDISLMTFFPESQNPWDSERMWAGRVLSPNTGGMHSYVMEIIVKTAFC